MSFVHEYVSNGFNGSQAYKAGFELGDSDKEDAVARTSAYRLLKKPVIQDAIDAEEGSYKAMARGMEMSRKEILKELKEVIWGERVMLDKNQVQITVGEDGKTKIAAINTLVKLTGDFSPERKEVDFSATKKIDTKNLSEEEIKELQATLLTEM